MAVTNNSVQQSLICICGDDTYRVLQAHRELVATTVTVYEGWFVGLSSSGQRAYSGIPAKRPVTELLLHAGRRKQRRQNQGPRSRLIARVSIVRSNPVGRCSMTLTPWDMFVIQTAIDRYEKAFPTKPSPSVAEALEWNANQSRRESRSKVRGPGSDRRQSLWSRASEFILTWWHTAPRRAREL